MKLATYPLGTQPLTSHMDPIEQGSKSAFTHGYVPIQDSTPAFVRGSESVGGTVSAYICAPSPVDGDQSVFTLGYDGITSSTSMFLRAETSNMIAALGTNAFGMEYLESVSNYVYLLVGGHENVENYIPIFLKGSEPKTAIHPLATTPFAMEGFNWVASSSQISFILAPTGSVTGDALGAYVFGHYASAAINQGGYISQEPIAFLTNRISGYINGAETIDPVTIGGAIRFEKSKSQHGRFSDVVNIRPTDEITVNFWMKGYTPAISARPSFILKQYGSSRSFGVYEGAVGTQKWHFGVDTDNGGWSAADTIGNWIADKWYMCTLRYSRYDQKCSFFVNGIKDSEFTKDGSIRWDTNPGYIAYRPDNGAYADMAFADLDIWNYALTDTEIASLWHPTLIQDGIGAFVSGTEFNVSQGILDVSVISTISQTNPAKMGGSQMCAIAFAAGTTTQACYIVAGDVTPGKKYDLKIVIDRFGANRHDLVIRIGGQGERARRTQLGDVEYPVTRGAYLDLPNAFYPDMPGKQFERQLCFINSGFQWNSVDGNVSGVENGPDAAVRNAYIHANKFLSSSRQNLYIHAMFTELSSGTSAFISNNDHTATQAAYISVGEVMSWSESLRAYIVAPPVPKIQSGIGAYIAGADSQSSSVQNAYIVASKLTTGYMNAFIMAEETTAIATDAASHVMAFVTSSVVAFDDGQLCYMEGILQIDTWLTLEENGLDFFLHAQPTIEGSLGLYMTSPWPWMHIQEALLFVYGNQPETIVQPLFIQSSLNVEQSQDFYLQASMPMDSARRAYIVSDLVSGPMSATARQTMFINCETPTEASTFCYISSAAYSIDSVDTFGYDAFIVSDILSTNPLIAESSIGGFISSVESSPSGELIAGSTSAFIVNTEVRSMEVSTGCFISSSDLGDSATSSTSAVIVNTEIRTIENSMGCSVIGEVIHPGGESITGATSAFITNEDALSLQASTGIYIASASNEGELLEVSAPTYIMNQDNLAIKTATKRCFIRVGGDTAPTQNCYIFGSYKVTEADSDIVAVFIEGHV